MLRHHQSRHLGNAIERRFMTLHELKDILVRFRPESNLETASLNSVLQASGRSADLFTEAQLNTKSLASSPLLLPLLLHNFM